MSMSDLEVEKLPEDLRAMNEADRAAQIKAKAEERNRLQGQLKELTTKRREYLAKEAAASGGAGAGSGFDAEVSRTVDKTLAKKRK